MGDDGVWDGKQLETKPYTPRDELLQYEYKVTDFIDD